ncbi:hypothetical protein D3C81_1925340 [compost metagenome]
MLERPAVGFGLSPEAVYDGRPLLDVGQARLGLANGSSPSSGDYNERTRWQKSPRLHRPRCIGQWRNRRQLQPGLGHQGQVRPGVLLPAGLHLRLPVRADRPGQPHS